jgi:hypothetical protein
VAHDGRKPAASQAAALLAAGESVRATALAVKVSERTIFRWRKNPKFQRAVDRLRADMVSAATGKLSDSLTKASDALTALLTSADDQVRLRAAVKVVELSLKLREFDELEKRVQDLEQLARAKGAN